MHLLKALFMCEVHTYVQLGLAVILKVRYELIPQKSVFFFYYYAFNFLLKQIRFLVEQKKIHQNSCLKPLDDPWPSRNLAQSASDPQLSSHPPHVLDAGPRYLKCVILQASILNSYLSFHHFTDCLFVILLVLVSTCRRISLHCL